MEDPQVSIPPTTTIQRNPTSEGKALADPPGWAVPMDHARHLEWWAHHQDQDQHHQSQQQQHQQQSQQPMHSQLENTPTQALHRYNDYVNNNKEEDDAFSWVPPPPVGGTNRSPDGWALTFRTLEAKRIYESAVPQRSWSVDSDKNDPPHGEQTVITDYTHNSWIMERPPVALAAEESVAKQTPKNQSANDMEEEIVVETVYDEETDTGTVEEEVIDEEIIEEEIIDDGDTEEFVDEEILEQVMSASESESYSCSTSFSQSQPQNPPTSSTRHAIPTKPPSANSFVPPRPTKEAKATAPPRRTSTKKAKTISTTTTPPPRKRSQRAPESVASSTHNSEMTPSKKKPISSSRKNPISKPSPSRPTRTRHNNNNNNNNNNNSYSAEGSSVDERTEDSGSTQILYIRDPHDLEEIVQKCFNGNVRIEDAGAPAIVEDYFVPSKYQLALLTVLIILVVLAIVVGLIVYFR